VLYGAALAGVGPVAAQDQPIFLIRVVVAETFTAGQIQTSSSDTWRKSCLPKHASAFAAEVIGFGNLTVMLGIRYGRSERARALLDELS
jgi:hypothetical protein